MVNIGTLYVLTHRLASLQRQRPQIRHGRGWLWGLCTSTCGWEGCHSPSCLRQQNFLESKRARRLQLHRLATVLADPVGGHPPPNRLLQEGAQRQEDEGGAPAKPSCTEGKWLDPEAEGCCVSSRTSPTRRGGLSPGELPFTGSGQTDFGPQLKSMNKQLFTLVAWDPRGYGKSIPPVRDFPVDFFERDAKDAVDLMQALKFKKFSLLGWSDGGITALIAAAKYPDLIHKMVVWGANANVTEEDAKLYNGIRDISKWSERVRKPMEEMYGREYLSKTCAAWVDGICQFIHQPNGSICQSLLPHIKCPTLIIHGEKDPLVPRAHPEYLHKRITGSQLYFVPEGKHNLHLRFAEEFNRIVEEFLL